MKKGAVTLPEYGKNEGLQVPHRVPLRLEGFQFQEERERVFLVGDPKKGTGHACVKRVLFEGTR